MRMERMMERGNQENRHRIQIGRQQISLRSAVKLFVIHSTLLIGFCRIETIIVKQDFFDKRINLMSPYNNDFSFISFSSSLILFSATGRSSGMVPPNLSIV
jgi:hypothetical protein